MTPPCGPNFRPQRVDTRSPGDYFQIFAGAATLTALAVGYGMPVAQPIDLQLDGGNLLDPKVRKQVWEQIEYEDPFLTAIAPVCAPWSSWQFVNFAKNDATAQKIMAERRLWYPVVEWIAKLVRRRTEKGRHVVLENPWLSLRWKLRCIEKLYGMEHPVTGELLEAIYLDQCQFGLSDLDTGLPHRKPTGMLSASRFIKEELAKTCPGGHEHQHLEGGRRTRLAAKWPEQLCKSILKGAFRELQELNCSVVFAAEGELEEMEEFGTLDAIHGSEDLGELDFVAADPRELRREEGLEESAPVSREEEAQPIFEKERRKKWLAIDRRKRLAIRRLHHMTGHASNEAMIRMLRAAGAAPEVVSACRHFRCQACCEKKTPSPPRAVAIPPPYKFNYQLSCDAFEIVDNAGAKPTVLSLVDSGTKFHVAGRVAPGGTPSSKSCANFINASWLSWAGPPRYFACDQGVHNKGQVSSLMRALGVEIKQAGAQSPWQIGRTERQGGILKAMLKRMIAEHQIEGEFGISAAINQATSVKNSNYNHAGYVPSQ